MRLAASLLLTAATAWGAGTFQISGEPGAWPRVLGAIGFLPHGGGPVNIFVLRSGAQATGDWLQQVDRGAFLILEGSSPLGEMLGFRAGKEQARVGSITDVHAPKVRIVWEHALELPVYEIPAGATVYAKERWGGAPVIAGMRRGTGGVLWVLTSPGERGYERFPYLPHALAAVGAQPPFRSNRLWAFFDSSYRLRADLDYFADQWVQAGVSALHVAAWHFHDRDTDRDSYLRRLMQAAHRRGILVYAWLELPHISEQFWNERPECREKTALLQDAHLDWRKLINLQNPACVASGRAGVRDLILRFDWDGVNLAELYFESLQGIENPARFTPMNADVRLQFRKASGIDPLDLFKNGAPMRDFLDFRATLAHKLQEEWMAFADGLRREKPHLDLVLTHVDDRFDSNMRDAIGADAARVLPMLDKYSFTFLVEDPATVWHLGPDRYTEIAKKYEALTPHREHLAIDLNIVERYQRVYPTKQQTGLELFQLIHTASRAFSRVAVYFEKSILPQDWDLLPAAAAVVNRAERFGDKLVLDSPNGVGVRWNGPALVNGSAWPVRDDAYVWLPAGTHTIEPGGGPLPLRLERLNVRLESARVLPSGIQFSYTSTSRGLAVLDRAPNEVEIDGVVVSPELHGESTIGLPRGQHVVVVR